MIASSYKKWVEQIGARAVVLPHWATNSEIETVLLQVNGLLIPGGGVSLFKSKKPTKYLKSVSRVMKVAYKMNKEVGSLPVWGICLGMEIMLESFGELKLKRIRIDTFNKVRKISWMKKNFEKSMFKKALAPSTVKNMMSMRLSYFHHKFGITKKNFNKNKLVKKNFNIVAFYEKHGKEIV